MNKHLNKLNLEVTELETQVGDNPECRVGDKTLQGPTSPGGFSTLTLELLWGREREFYSPQKGELREISLNFFLVLILKICKSIVMNLYVLFTHIHRLLAFVHIWVFFFFFLPLNTSAYVS